MAFPFQSFFVRNDRKKPPQQGQPPTGRQVAPPSSQPPLPGGGGGGPAAHAHGAHPGQYHPHQQQHQQQQQQQQQSTADYYADPLSLPGIIVPGAAQANANATAGTHHYSSAPHFTIPANTTASSSHSSPQLTYHAGNSAGRATASSTTPAVSPYLGYQQQPPQQQQYPHYHQQHSTYPSATTPQPQPHSGSAAAYPPTTPTFSASADPTTPTTPGLSSQLQHLSTSAPTTPGAAADTRSLGGGTGAASDAWSLRSRRSSVATSIAPVDEDVTDVHIDEIILAANEIAAIAATCKPSVDASGTTPPSTTPVTVADLLTTPTGSRQFMLLWRRTLDLCAAVVRIRDNVSVQGTLDDLEGDDMEEIRRRRYLGSLTGGGLGAGNRVRSKSRGSVKSTKSDGAGVAAGASATSAAATTTTTKGRPAKDGQRCASCGTGSTPEWRRGPLGPGTLCNACGLHYSKMKRQRKKKEAELAQQQQAQQDQALSQQDPAETDPTLADVMRIVNGDPGDPPAPTTPSGGGVGTDDNMQGVQQTPAYDPPAPSPSMQQPQPQPQPPQQQAAYPSASGTDGLGFPAAVAPQHPHHAYQPQQQQVQYQYTGDTSAGGAGGGAYPHATVYVIPQHPHQHPQQQGYAPPYPIQSYAATTAGPAGAHVQYTVVQHHAQAQQQGQPHAYVYPSAVPPQHAQGVQPNQGPTGQGHGQGQG